MTKRNTGSSGADAMVTVLSTESTRATRCADPLRMISRHTTRCTHAARQGIMNAANQEPQGESFA